FPCVLCVGRGSPGLETARRRCRAQGAASSEERSVGRAAATGAGVATVAFRGLPCTSPIRCRRPSKSPCGRRVGTPLERGVARRAPDRRGNRGAGGEEPGAIEGAGATALGAPGGGSPPA